MGATEIEWATDSWNPVTGCTPVSAGCAHCYAKRMSTRLRGRFSYPADEPFRVTLYPDRLDQPRHWRWPRRVFVCSMGDLFHPDVPFEFREKIWQTMFAATRHTYMILTKRPQRMAEEWHSLECLGRGLAFWNGQPASHIWAGTTCEDQATANERLLWLQKCPAAVRFVSHEPALGRVDWQFTDWVCARCRGPVTRTQRLRHATIDCATCGPDQHFVKIFVGNDIDLIIAGGETGPGARPTHPNVFRSDRDQCVAAGVKFFFKGWGDCAPIGAMSLDGVRRVHAGLRRIPEGRIDTGSESMFRVGKKAAGRLLDGRTWDEMPE